MKALTMMFLCFFIVNTTYAQTPPANDNVCSAMDVTLGLPGVFMVVDTATLETGETVINPPLGDCENGWCDDGGLDGSVWFTFTAPAGGAVNISLCGSAYDSQLALYEVGNCADFTTFSYIFGNDDTPGGTPGSECGLADPNTAGYGLGSEFDIFCLTPGQVYYVVVDTWLATAGGPQPTGQILDLKINALTGPPPTASITNVLVEDPLCPGGANGTATVEFTGAGPFSILWSDGQMTPTATGLAMGSYNVSITDFCGGTANQTVMVNDGVPPSPPTVGNLGILAAKCGADGTASIEVLTGTPPFTWLWSTGSTEHQPSLPAGTHTVSITDGCGTSTISQTVVIPGGTDVSNENFTIDPVSGCSVTFNGVVNNVSPVTNNNVTYNIDQTIGGNIACRGGGFISDNGFWRAFNLAGDFGINAPFLIGELELGVFSANATLGEGHQPIEIRIYNVTSMDLSVSTNTLMKTVKWTVADRPSTAAGFIYIPIDYEVPAGQLFAVEVWNPNGTTLGRTLGIGANTTAALGGTETFITSNGCSIPTPTPMSTIGFPHQTVFNLVQYTYNPVTWTPATYLDNAAALAPILTIPAGTVNPSNTAVYTVTVVDGCGSTQMATATVDVSACILLSNEDLVDVSSFTISPNPSSGLFNITNDGAAREMTLEVYDLSGKNLVSKVITLGQGDVTALDLSAVASGMYIAKLTDGDQAEIHKLIVE